MVLLEAMTSELKPIILLKPDKTRGFPVMKALDIRASVREWSSKMLKLQDLSDLLWAACGINRTDEGKRTASSSMNSQDVDVYVFLEEGIYIYDEHRHILIPLVAGDYRDLPGLTDAPLNLVLITDISRFSKGTETEKIGWANIGCGIISQNISLFCASTGIKTRPRASCPGAAKIRELLKLKKSQHILLNHPIGYEKNMVSF
jgi:hypothetical protein